MKKIIVLSLFFLFIPALVFASGTVGESNSTSLSSGLVGYWTLDGSKTNWLTGTTQDSSGNGNTGSLLSMSTTTSPVAGKIGQALKFNGTAAQDIIVKNGPILSGDTAFSIAAWINTTSANTGDGRAIYSERASSGNDIIKLDSLASNCSGGVMFTIRNDGGTLLQGACKTNLNNGLWHHVVVTLNGAGVSMYVDGVLSATATWSGTDTFTNSGLTSIIGGDQGDSSSRWLGTIDDLRLYNRALSAQEVAQLYAEGKTNVAHSNTVTLSSGLVGYWTLDGSKTNWNTGTTQDSSGNGNTGLLVNMSTTTSPTAGKIGQALNFTNIVGQGVNFSTNGFSNQTGTISAWVDPTAAAIAASAGSNGGEIFCHGDAITCGSGDRLYMQFEGGNFQIGVGASSNITIAGANPQANHWDLWSFTYNNGAYVAYKDGVALQSGSYTNTLTIQSTAGIASKSSGASSFSGDIDDVRVYNRVLSPQEMAQLYGESTANIGHSNTVTVLSGLLDYLTFDGNKINWTTGKALDSSGNNFSNTIVSMSTSTSPTQGKIGQGLLFNGSSSYVVTPSLGTPPTSVSLAAWIKPNAAGGVVLDELGTAVPNAGWHDSEIEVETNNSIKVCVWIGSLNCITAATGITYGKWYHVVLDYNSVTKVLSGYINGVLGASQTGVTKQYPSTGQQFYGIGSTDSTNGGDGSYFSGSIDDVRIYNRALSAQDVAQLYAMGK